MHQEVKIRKIGSSDGIILTKDILEQLNVKTGDSLHLIKKKSGEITLTSYDPVFEEQMSVALDGMERYKHALRELADR